MSRRSPPWSATAVSPQSVASRKLARDRDLLGRLHPERDRDDPYRGRSDATVTAVPSPAPAAIATTVKLGIGGTLAAKIKSALAANHQVTATIVGTVVDGAGKTERKSAPVAVVLTR